MGTENSLVDEYYNKSVMFSLEQFTQSINVKYRCKIYNANKIDFNNSHLHACKL